MSVSFDPQDDLIIVRAALIGPTSLLMVRLVLDTGASQTLISPTLLQWIGYDTDAAVNYSAIVAVGSSGQAPVIPVEKIVALGQQKDAFPVLAQAMPTRAGIDGLLGLDFLRGHALRIDFRQGEIELT